MKPVVNIFDKRLLVGDWFGITSVGGLGIVQLCLNDGGRVKFVDYGRGEEISGTYNIVDDELMIRSTVSCAKRRWRIVSVRPERIVFYFPELDSEVSFHPDRLAQ